MVKISNNPCVRIAKSPGKSDQVIPSEQIKPADVSWVLEHVSSPFRWAVLEFNSSTANIYCSRDAKSPLWRVSR